MRTDCRQVGGHDESRGKAPIRSNVMMVRGLLTVYLPNTIKLTILVRFVNFIWKQNEGS